MLPSSQWPRGPGGVLEERALTLSIRFDAFMLELLVLRSSAWCRLWQIRSELGGRRRTALICLLSSVLCPPSEKHGSNGLGISGGALMDSVEHLSRICVSKSTGSCDCIAA